MGTHENYSTKWHNLKEVIVVNDHWKCKLWHVGICIGPIGFSFMPNDYDMNPEYQ
jgi:hypothetical protein